MSVPAPKSTDSISTCPNQNDRMTTFVPEQIIGVDAEGTKILQINCIYCGFVLSPLSYEERAEHSTKCWKKRFGQHDYQPFRGTVPAQAMGFVNTGILGQDKLEVVPSWRSHPGECPTCRQGMNGLDSIEACVHRIVCIIDYAMRQEDEAKRCPICAGEMGDTEYQHLWHIDLCNGLATDREEESDQHENVYVEAMARLSARRELVKFAQNRTRLGCIAEQGKSRRHVSALRAGMITGENMLPYGPSPLRHVALESGESVVVDTDGCMAGKVISEINYPRFRANKFPIPVEKEISLGNCKMFVGLRAEEGREKCKDVAEFEGLHDKLEEMEEQWTDRFASDDTYKTPAFSDCENESVELATDMPPSNGIHTRHAASPQLTPEQKVATLKGQNEAKTVAEQPQVALQFQQHEDSSTETMAEWIEIAQDWIEEYVEMELAATR